MNRNINPIVGPFFKVFGRAFFFTSVFLLLEFTTISLVYHNEVKDLKERLIQTTEKEGNNIYLICNYINCTGVVHEGMEYYNSEVGLVTNEGKKLNTKLFMFFFNTDLDTLIKYSDTVYVVSNENKWKFINRLLALSTVILFITIFILSLKIHMDNLKVEKKYRSSMRNDLESKLQRDLTESLHHEMGTPLAIIRTLMEEIIKSMYPCINTTPSICNYIIYGKEIDACDKCDIKEKKRNIDNKIASYYEQLRFAVDSLYSLQTIIGKSKKISYSNGTVSIFEILNNVITSSNQLRIKNLTANYKQKGILDTHSCRGIQNGEMLMIVNNLVLNSIEAHATSISISTTLTDTGFLCLDIKDDGCGIRDVNNNVIKDYNIFKYGYSTKDKDGKNIINTNWLTSLLYRINLLVRDNEFRGAGLSLCKDLLRKNGGDIMLVETSKEGTTFRLKIPVKVTHNTSEVISFLS